MLPRLVVADPGPGFRWLHPDGTPARLADLLDLPDAEPERWLPTHLEALDEASIEVTGQFGAVLGGERRPSEPERAELTRAYVALDRACREYAEALARTAPRLGPDVRAGQIVGTAGLLGVLAREALGLLGPAPFAGRLDRPTPGTVGGRAGLHWVDKRRPWLGARWLVVTDDGRRLPATLAMLLYDSSGVDKDAILREHRDALAQVTAAAVTAGVSSASSAASTAAVDDGDQARDASAYVTEPMAASGALDWLFFDWVMAHREAENSPAVRIGADGRADAAMLIAAVAASVALRARFDPALADA